MTDFPPPPPPDEPDPAVGPPARGADDPVRDELASALLDGQLSSEEAIRAQADPEVLARVTAMTQARAELRAVPPPPAGHADAAIAAALAAAVPAQPQPSHLQAVPPTPGPLPPVAAGMPPGASPSPFPPQHPAGSGGGGSPYRWLAAAAAVVVVALVAVGVLSNDANDENAVTGSPDRRAEVPSADAEGSSDAGAGGAGGGDESGGAAEPGRGDSNGDAQETSDVPAAAGSGVEDLGTVSRDELLDEVTASMSAGDGGDPDATSADQTELDNSSCPGLSVLGDPDRGDALYVADAILDGTPVRIHVYDNVDDGTLQLVATDESCSDVVDQPFGR
jgi:hypothetical protein